MAINDPRSGLELIANLEFLSEFDREEIIEETRGIFTKISGNVGSVQLAKIYLSELVKEINKAIESKEENRINKLKYAARCLVLIEIQSLLASLLIALNASSGSNKRKDKKCSEALGTLLEKLAKQS